MNPYHFSGKWQHVAPVGTDCPGQASVRYRVKGVTLHPNGRVRRRWRSPEFERHSPNPSPTDFYVHLNIARYVLSNKKCDCNLLNNRFLKKKSITMGNDIETSELL